MDDLTIREIEMVSDERSIHLVSKLLDENRSEGRPFLLTRYPNQTIKIASHSPLSRAAFSFATFDKSVEINLTELEYLDFNDLSDYIPFECANTEVEEKDLKINIIDRQRFMENVDLAKAKIRKGELKKVVLSKAKKIDKNIDPILTFLNLEKEYKSALVYCFYHPKCGLWIGASPEKLLERDEDQEYHIHSLAGTKKLNAEWTEKEVKEQKIVTEYITERLKVVGAEKLNIEGPSDYLYGSIKHLKSSIHFRSDASMRHIVEHIHPTPAICGMPLETSKKFILDNERYDRTFYTGYIGLNGFDGINHTYFVNLRCMQVNKENAYIYTGAGIVADSDPASEWEEVETKAQTLLDCISTNGEHNK